MDFGLREKNSSAASHFSDWPFKEPVAPWHQSHLQHVADVENGAVLSGVHVRRDVAVFVLDRHAPAGKLHHLSSVCPVEIKERSLLQGSLEGD